MRLIGIVLVLVGALALGVRGVSQLTGGSAADIPPAVGGIAVVGGLLLLAGDGRRD